MESDIISIDVNHVESKITYYNDDCSDEIQAVLTRNTRQNQLMKHFIIPEASLSATCTHDMKTEPKITNLIEAKQSTMRVN